jgi:cellulose synthase/poly-beta-1,6-N-acetylglucosamine synthase-like glycosyltransferase/CheY-like chemotaxis protein
MENETILIVEDEMITAMDIHDKLEDSGYTVVGVVSNGEDAVRTAAEIRPDLVIMDIRLQGEMDGIESSHKILALDIPVVYLTALTDKDTLEQAMQTPSYGYLIKPLDDKKLYSTVKMAIQKHEKYMEQLEGAEHGVLSKKIEFKIGKSDIKKIEAKINRYGDVEKDVKVVNGKVESTKAPRIIIVEDESITTMDITHKLNQLGYEVVATAKSGNSAIRKVEKFHPDLILMDISLNGPIDGIEVANRIKNLEIPIIFLTAYSDEKLLNRAKSASPYGYLLKPFEEKEIQSTVQMALKKYHSDRKNVENIEIKIKTKSEELKVEKRGILILSAIVTILIAYGFITLNMTWLEYLLFIPAVYNIIIVSVSLRKPALPINDDNVKPFVSILIPAHNEEYTIENCVKTLAKLDYSVDGHPNYEIIVINDGSIDKTGEVLRDLKESLKKENFNSLKIITRKPPRAGKGKGYVLNDGLKLCNGEVVAVFDADTIVKPDFLKIIVPYLNKNGVEGVQARVQMYNKDENLLTAMQEVEFGIFGNVILKARDIMDSSAYLGGNGQLTTKKAVERIGGWDGYAVTEDLNMSIKFMINGFKIRYCPEAVVYQEAVSSWSPFFRQRIRWATGTLETLFVYLEKIMEAPIPFYKKIDSLQYLFFLILLAFVMLGYLVVILYLGSMMHFSLMAPITIGILSTIAFFPGLVIGLYKDTKKIHVSIYKAAEYWVYCLYLLPLFFATFIKMLTRHERQWAKTNHVGLEIKIPTKSER